MEKIKNNMHSSKLILTISYKMFGLDNLSSISLEDTLLFVFSERDSSTVLEGPFYASKKMKLRLKLSQSVSNLKQDSMIVLLRRLTKKINLEVMMKAMMCLRLVWQALMIVIWISLIWKKKRKNMS